jgi:DNA-binding GntR family transcriptional regulator
MTYTPKFQTIVDFVTEKISSGEWLEGDRLPSISSFRDDYGFKYGTLRGALLVLKTQGLVEGHQGDGMYVSKSNISVSAPAKRKKT